MYLMSAPATKAFSPAPVRTTTRDVVVVARARAGGRAAPSSVATSSAFIASGRSTVTTATASVALDVDGS